MVLTSKYVTHKSKRMEDTSQSQSKENLLRTGKGADVLGSIEKKGTKALCTAEKLQPDKGMSIEDRKKKVKGLMAGGRYFWL